MTIKKVMLIDDDENIRRVAVMVLTKVGGWQVIACSSAIEALEKLDCEVPDVILLDVMMPVLDGITAFPRIRAKSGTTPIIFMTAKPMMHELAACLASGAAGLIAKPFEAMALSSQVESIVTSYNQKQLQPICA